MALQSIPAHFLIPEEIPVKHQAYLNEMVEKLKSDFLGITRKLDNPEDEKMLLEIAVEILRMAARNVPET